MLCVPGYIAWMARLAVCHTCTVLSQNRLFPYVLRALCMPHSVPAAATCWRFLNGSSFSCQCNCQLTCRMLGQLPQHLAISAMNLAVQLYIHVVSLLLCVLWLGGCSLSAQLCLISLQVDHDLPIWISAAFCQLQAPSWLWRTTKSWPDQLSGTLSTLLSAAPRSTDSQADELCLVSSVDVCL